MFRIVACLVWVFAGVAAFAAELIDPTAPPNMVRPAVSEVAPSTPKLTSVLFSDQRRIAVIAGQVMAEGTSVNGIKLWRVARDYVEVSLNQGARQTLRLEDIHKEIK